MAFDDPNEPYVKRPRIFRDEDGEEYMEDFDSPNVFDDEDEDEDEDIEDAEFEDIDEDEDEEAG